MTDPQGYRWLRPEAWINWIAKRPPWGNILHHWYFLSTVKVILNCLVWAWFSGQGCSHKHLYTVMWPMNEIPGMVILWGSVTEKPPSFSQRTSVGRYSSTALLLGLMHVSLGMPSLRGPDSSLLGYFSGLWMHQATLGYEAVSSSGTKS